MAETFHDDMENHLHAERAKAQAGINAVWELEKRGDKYIPTERMKLVDEAKVSCGHDRCSVAGNYKGNPRPPEVAE
jgi:hypothetical protein